ncbi:MAG: DUF1501 domain-containing protein [Planctomycetaceae bacterium]
MTFPFDHGRLQTRRRFLKSCHFGVGGLALSSLLGGSAGAAGRDRNTPLAPKTPAMPARAKGIIYLEMTGGPPQQELFDYKPELIKRNMQPCPDEILKNQKFAFIKGHPNMLGTPYTFKQHGDSGAWVSELLPHTAKIVDELTIIRSFNTGQFNHAPADLLMFTGSPRFGNASLGSWITYGLGSESQELPAFIVLTSGSDPTGGKSVWGSAYLPSVYQGVQCRSSGEPILFATDPQGMTRAMRRRSLDALRKLNEIELKEIGDPETISRIEQYELAYRMQTSVPEVMDISQEPKHVQEMYGAEPGKSSLSNNCLLARRLIEKGVRFVQLFDWGWDTHGTDKSNDLVTQLPKKCKEADQPIAALITDLKQRGLLEETLVVWGGEFGRTSMNEERNGSRFLGRDHHPHCATIWMAGGGAKKGLNYGATDDLGYFVAENSISVHDLHATILHLMGLDAKRLTYPYQGLDQRLIGPTDEARVIHDVLA